MRLIMNEGRLQTIEEVRQFLEWSERYEFRGLTVAEKYDWMEGVLMRFKYHRLKRAEMGVERYPYEEVMTPYEKLRALPKEENCLLPGVTFERLEAFANQMSDNEFAERMVKARFDLFRQISRFVSRVA